MIDIVITMAGVGSRFRKAGYDKPKYMLEVCGQTLFELSIKSLAGYMNEAEKFIFVVMRDEKFDVEKFISEKCEMLGIKKIHTIVIDYLTDGQATTAILASKFWNKENALLVYNIDTYVEEWQLKSEDIKGDGFIPCFHADGTHWSFVKLDERGKAVEVREKERISDNCTLGAYYFRTCSLYEKLYNEYYVGKSNLTNGEKYIAPLYNHLIKIGGDVRVTIIDFAKVHVLGTPEEYEAAKKDDTWKMLS